MSNAEATPRQRGPYANRAARQSYAERLALRAVARPACKCGCGTLTRWLSSKARWAVYVDGHYRRALPYKDEAWMREQYGVRRRTTEEIAEEFGVSRSTIRKSLLRMGIERRSRSDSRLGRHVGAQNPAWKGGVADWDYSTDWKSLARRIRDRDEWTCQDCGEQRKRWGHALHVHHIDGDKLNNDLGNLISLCAGCHRAAHKEVI